MNEIPEILKELPPEVVEAAYSDAISGTLKEASKIGIDAVKTFRLALFPLQFAAAIQDRLALYIDQAIRKVPEARRIPPMESIALQVAEKLRFQEADNVITTLYISLLARAMDKERVGEAHPAFLNLISQLAPDEVGLLEQLAVADYKVYMRDRHQNKVLLESERSELIKHSSLPPGLVKRTIVISLQPELLGQPELFYTFIEHLVSLGVIAYTNDPTNGGEYNGIRKFGKTDLLFLKLSEFGRLFHSACVSTNIKQ